MEEGKQYELFSGKKSISSGKIKFNQFPNLREKIDLYFIFFYQFIRRIGKME